ncbi:CAMK/CAMKL protein kinase [Nannizzia gypsea CBS 118893]|uniref:non-specific serine/threonine protein kinase n=1 Tax=Arthroderma gypseum (strain ATCC MYA-4604 / CBS 118893) TaxID=535722 RepID=E4UUY2_ARTGP|nr:CAMK/CAMKL protein kinase [Nannizzia gypsea CBS 118893]EFR01099.1 CAMK/CAMKL protein kinase [Nannizzia gypsea CBS 118893]
MPGLNFIYEYFCYFVPILTRASSSPTDTSNLNLLILQVLTRYSGSTIYGVGGHSVLISISDELAVKVAYRAGGEHVRHEQSVFELLETKPCPYIAHSYFSALDMIFMELVKNGTLYDRIRQVDPILKWMQQLAEAAVTLENIGYAHGDINPRNILFDDEDNLRLVDFDGSRGGRGAIRHRYMNYGKAGPDTEQFALGSVLWYLSRGKELYSDIDGVEKVNRRAGAKFESMAALAKRVRQVAFDKSLEEKKSVCEQHYSSLRATLDSN